MSGKNNEVWVIGHKNPDTDSICSAICYAELKNKLSGGDKLYIPKKTANVNDETKFALDHFGFAEPETVTDVRSQLSDVEFHHVPGVDGDISIREAWAKMREYNIVTLPVTEGKKLEGIVTIGDLSRTVFDVIDRYQMSDAATPYANVQSVLEAEVVTGDVSGTFDKGRVVVSSANQDQMAKLIEPGDIVILENREDSHINAIETRAGCIILCNESKVSDDIVSKAEENGTIVLRTKYDPVTCVRLINQSIPIRSLYRSGDDLQKFKLDDYVEDITDPMTQVRFRYFPVEDENGEYVGLVSKGDLLKAGKKQVILVDHEELAQAVDGVNKAEVLEIIDHHRLGGMTTPQPLFARIQPMGCTCTIIYNMYKEEGITPDKDIAGLMLSAICSDTLLFTSPTCTPHDKIAAKELEKIAEVDTHDYAMDMFKAGSNWGSKSAEEILTNDFKKFEMGGRVVGVDQVNITSESDVDDIYDKIKPELKGFMNAQCAHNLYVMITDIIKGNSVLVAAGDGGVELMERTFGKKADGDRMMLEGVVSRKKQIVPPLTEALQ